MGTTPGPAGPARPQLRTALRRVWRDAATLQLGLDPARAVVIGGLDPATARLVERLDGTRDLRGVYATATELGVDTARTAHILELLRRSGVLDDGAADHRPLRELRQRDRDRLAPDVAAASVVRPGADGGAGVLARRRSALVDVHGAGRVGASVVTLLAAAGVGCLRVFDPGTANVADCAPAGLAADDEGARRQDAAIRAARRVCGSLRQPPAGSGEPDLAVLAPTGPLDPRLLDRLVRSGVAHLFATVREGSGIVGPLVLPGRSSCGRCHDLHRSDRDPAWPAISAQLAGTAPTRTAPCDVALATAVASHAALQALAFLDEGADPSASGRLPTCDGTIEIAQGDGRVRRRSWSVHPSCGCHWSAP